VSEWSVICNQGDIYINIDKHINKEHKGYGSNVSLRTTLFIALNNLFNNPFNEYEIFEILTNNYFENYDDNYLIRGFETGVGTASLIFGGIVLVDANCNYIGNISHLDLNINKLHCLLIEPQDNFYCRDWFPGPDG